MGLDTLGKDFATTGIMPGYMSGQTHGAGLASTLAATKQKQLESERYAAETPDYLAQAGYNTEKARLGNLQGQADEQAGTYGAKAKLEAQKAQEAFKTLPLETQQKMRQMTIQRSSDLLNIMEKAVATTGSTQAGIEAVTSAYPEIVNDKGWQQAVQQYSALTPEQVMSKIKQTRHGFASSDAYANPEVQGKLIQETVDQSGRVDLANINNAARLREQELQNSGALAAAGVRATSGGSLSTAELLSKWIDIRDAAQPGSPEWKRASQNIDIIQRQGFEQQSSSIPGLPGKDKSKSLTGQDYGGGSPTSPRASAPKGFVRGEDGILRKAQ